MPVLTLTANKDSYVNDGSRNSNFNTNPLLVSNSNISGNMRATFIGFDLSPLPDNAMVTSVYLKFNILSQGGSGSFYINEISSDWAETAITYATQPVYMNNLNDFLAVGLKTINVTSMFTKAGTKGYRLSTSGDKNCQISDRTQASPPQLVIDYVSPPIPEGTVYNCIANATTDSAAPSVNKSTELVSSSTKDCYLKFDSVVPPVGKILDKVKLCIRPNIANVAITCPVNYVNAAWVENTITYSNKAALSLFKNVTIDATASYNLVDISGIDLTKLNANGINIGSQATTIKTFDIKTSAFKPYLDVTFKDTPPSKPYLVSPSPGMLINRANAFKIEWLSVDTQHSFEVSYSGDGVTYSALTGSGALKEFQTTPNFFSNGPLFLKVRYKKTATSDFSEYSSPVLVKVTEKPIQPTITTPSTITSATPMIEWTSTNQFGYELKINGEVIEGNGSTQGYQLIKPLSDNTAYEVKLRVRNGDGFYSDFAVKQITTNIAKPEKPSITAEVQSNSFIKIVPTTTDGAINDIYKIVKGIPIRIAKGLSSGTVIYDYKVAHGIQYGYFARAINTLFGSKDSDVIYAKVDLKYGDLTTVDAELSVKFQYNISKTISNRIDAADHKLAGRKMPVREFSFNESRQLAINFEVMTMDEVNAVEAMAMLKKVVTYRDLRGRLLYVSFTGVSVEDLVNTYKVTLNDCIEVDYTEVI